MSQVSDETIALIKGMHQRGDKNQDIAACFGVNQARVAEIHHAMTRNASKDDVSLTKRARAILAAALDDLPPKGPYPTPYDLFRTGRSLWHVRAALEGVSAQVQKALTVVHKAEDRLK